MKQCPLFLLMIVLIHPVFGQPDPTDIIVLVDTSASMEGCFPEIVAYMNNEILSSQVKEGDIFHLIQFSTLPEHAITRKIEGRQSILEIRKALAFLREKVLFGRYTDIVMALNNLIAYVSALPAERQKKIFFFTDAVNDPPDQSPYAEQDAGMIQSGLFGCMDMMENKNGWFALRLDVPGNLDLELLIRSIESEDTDPVFLQTLMKNKQIYPIVQLITSLEKSSNTAGTGNGAKSRFFSRDAWFSGFFRVINTNGFAFGFFIMIILIFSIIIFVKKKKLDASFRQIINPKKWQENLSILFGSSDSLVEMRVTFQNPHIGFRNIHRMKENRNMTIGGGLSQFLIFLIPIPQHIAEIALEDGKYVFKPVRKEFFPGLCRDIPDCLNREIPVILKHGYSSIITFTSYVSPLARLNTLFRSIKDPDENIKEILRSHKLALANEGRID